MKPEQEDFNDLRRLLKLKRYEKPPPGYFEDFSSHVVSQIKAGGRIRPDNVLEWLYFEAPWLERLVHVFEQKPYVAWGMGAAACAVIISGVVLTQNAEYTPVTTLPVAEKSALTPISTEMPGLATQQAQADVNSSNQPAGSLFDQIQPQTQPAGWHP